MKYFHYNAEALLEVSESLKFCTWEGEEMTKTMQPSDRIIGARVLIQSQSFQRCSGRCQPHSDFRVCSNPCRRPDRIRCCRLIPIAFCGLQTTPYLRDPLALRNSTPWWLPTVSTPCVSPNSDDNGASVLHLKMWNFNRFLPIEFRPLMISLYF